MRSRPPVPPVVLLLMSMTAVQTGAALAVPVLADYGYAGTTWLRLSLASLVLLVVVRPRGLARAEWVAAAALGTVMAVNATLFAAATQRLPLGVTVAVEFCGPLAVGAAGARGRGRAWLLWPAMGLAGVLLLTRPWSIGGGGAREVWIGLCLAALAGAGWGTYILLAAHVGRSREGWSGLAVALTVGAVVLAPLGAPQAWSGLPSTGPGPALRVLVAMLLYPLGCYAFELAALRRMRSELFGVWMSLEPALGAVTGVLLLGQAVRPVQIPAFALVVLAGIGAQRTATAVSAEPEPDVSPLIAAT